MRRLVTTLGHQATSWLGQRDGQTYRLVAAPEWLTHLATTKTAACAGGQQTCAGKMREWPAPCAPGCTRQPALGRSWRDTGASSGSEVTVDPAFGYDDIGFRLVRDVSPGELEQR